MIFYDFLINILCDFIDLTEVIKEFLQGFSHFFPVTVYQNLSKAASGFEIGFTICTQKTT